MIKLWKAYLAEDAARRHVLLSLELRKVEAGGEHEDVRHGEQPLEEGEADLEGETLGGNIIIELRPDIVLLPG